MRRWLPAAIPAVLGALTWLVLRFGLGERRRVYLETDFSGFWLGIGVGISLLWLGIVVLNVRHRRTMAASRAAGRAQQREDHRNFLRRLDHELKNPIMGIRAAVANASGHDPAFASIEAQSQRLTRLLGDLRKLSEVQSAELEVAPVRLDVLADEVLQVAQEIPGSADRVITRSFPRAPRPLPSVPGDADLLFLALYNLVANAVKYSAPGDTIEIRGREAGAGVTLEVADTGLGIAREDMASVWEELTRGRATRHIEGSGLGLPFVHAIVTRHGGHASMSSELGVGTVASVFLPG